MSRETLVVPYGNGLTAALESAQPLRLGTMTWDFPERPDLIALVERRARLEFLRDHLKALCGLWERLPRLFLDAYFRDIAHRTRQNRSAIGAPAAVHGGLFDPEDWSFAAFCPLPRARLPAAPTAPIDFAFWTGAVLHAVFIKGAGSPSRAPREGRTSLQEAGVLVTEIPGADLARAEMGDLLAHLPADVADFWKGVFLPSSPFRIGELDEILPA